MYHRDDLYFAIHITIVINGIQVGLEINVAKTKLWLDNQPSPHPTKIPIDGVDIEEVVAASAISAATSQMISERICVQRPEYWRWSKLCWSLCVKRPVLPINNHSGSVFWVANLQHVFIACCIVIVRGSSITHVCGCIGCWAKKQTYGNKSYYAILRIESCTSMNRTITALKTRVGAILYNIPWVKLCVHHSIN